jgi:hypothetical protein
MEKIGRKKSFVVFTACVKGLTREDILNAKRLMKNELAGS